MSTPALSESCNASFAHIQPITGGCAEAIFATSCSWTLVPDPDDECNNRRRCLRQWSGDSQSTDSCLPQMASGAIEPCMQARLPSIQANKLCRCKPLLHCSVPRSCDVCLSGVQARGICCTRRSRAVCSRDTTNTYIFMYERTR
jgi:hypothetical protein